MESKVNRVRLFRHKTGFVPAPNGGNSQYVGFDLQSGEFFTLFRNGTFEKYQSMTMEILRRLLEENEWIEIDPESPDGTTTV